MKKRFIISTGILTGCFGLVLAVLAMVPQPRLTEEKIAAIQIGMTIGEVEGVLGFPPGDYSLDGCCLPINMFAYGKEQRERQDKFKEWAADTPTPRYEDGNGPNRQDAIAVRVWFDQNGKVIDKCRMGYSYTAPSVTAQLKRLWLRWW